MRSFFSLLVLSVLFPALLMAQNETSTLKKAEQMVASRQYASAYRLLDEYDPSNDNIAVLLKKEEIVLKYFAQSMMHRFFSLKDLNDGETLQSVRQGFETGDMFSFDVDSLIRRLLVSHSGDCRLLSGYACFCEALLNDYDEEIWSASFDAGLMRQAASEKCNSASACYQMGLYHDYERRPDSAATFYRRATKLCDTMWHAFYNLGIAEGFRLSMTTQGVDDLHKALHGYTAPVFKADAARVLGILYDESIHNTDSAAKYYNMAVEIDGNSYTNRVILAAFFASHDNPKTYNAINNAWKTAWDADYSMDDFYTMLVTVSERAGNSKAVCDFLKQKLNKSDDVYEQGLCCLFLGKFVEDGSSAVNYLRDAIIHFRQVDAPEAFIEALQEEIDERSGR